MDDVFLGSESLRAGAITRGRLRWQYSTVFPDVYVAKLIEPSLRQRTVGAWLWSGRRGVVAGRAAAAFHGALWVEAHTPIELISSCTRPPPGIITRREQLSDDEIVYLDGIPVTSPQRTAFDIARHQSRDEAVRHLDALVRATTVSAEDVLALGRRYPRARGYRTWSRAIDLMDGGAQSPKETCCACWSSMRDFRGHVPRFA